MNCFNIRLLIVFAVLFMLAAGAADSSRAQWVQTNGPYSGNIDCFAVMGTNTSSPLLFAGAYGGNGLSLSIDSGTSWKVVSNGWINTDIRALAVSGTNLFAATNLGVSHSTDSGASWTLAHNGMQDTGGRSLEVTALAVMNSNASSPMLFAGTRDIGVYLSTDNGANWVAVNNGLTYFIDYTAIKAFAVIGTNSASPMLFAGMQGTRFGAYLSTDSGKSWAASGLPGTSVQAFAVIDSNSSSPMLFAGTDDSGVFLSTDKGSSWMHTGLTHADVRALVVRNENSSSPILYAGTRNGGVFFSADKGTSWTAENTGLTSTYVNTLAVSGTNLFAGTQGSGVWRRPLSEMIPQSAVPQPPVKTQELRTYPNPLSQSTTISFTPEASGYAEISIVNLLGVEVARLFAGELGAGERTFVWDASAGATEDGCATGVYECLVRMNGRVEKLPVMLLR